MISRRIAHLLAVLAGILPLGARASTVWTAVASEKLRPDAQPRATRTGTVAAAKNEFEAFQVVVTGPARNVSADASELKGPGTISGVKLYREALIDLAHPSAADGATGRFPDALVPDVDDVVGEKRNAFPFDVPAGESRAIWVEVHVPADAKAGVYQGTVNVHADDGATAVPVQLTVWDFALPSTSSLKTAFKMTQGGIEKVHRVSGEAETRLRQLYTQLALDHRISISSPHFDDNHDGWSHFDSAYGPFLAGTANTRLKGARLTSLESSADLTSTPAQADWAAHAKANGWFDRLFQYTCDEPPITCSFDDIKNRTAAAKAADPAFRTLVTTNISDAKGHGIDGAIDLMVPLINDLDDRPTSDYGWKEGGETRPQYDGFLSGKGKELWMYESCMSHGCGGTVDIGNPSADQKYFMGWPSYMVDASAVRARALEWFSFRYGATGELYYETTQSYYDSDDVWSSVWTFNGNGDGTLFYPGLTSKIGGSTDIPVASLRMKMIREGMEDFEYLKLLSDVGGADEARSIAKALFPVAYQSDVKPDDLMAAREQLARSILAHTGKAAPAAGASMPGGLGHEAQALSGGGCGSTGPGAGLVSFALLPLALVWRRRVSPRAR